MIVRTLKGLWYESPLPPQQNKCGYGYSKSNINGKYSHVPHVNKEFVKEVQKFTRLGVQLEDSPKESSILHHNSDSSLDVDMKSNKHFDPLLIKLKETIISKFSEEFSPWRWNTYVPRKVVCVGCAWPKKTNFGWDSWFLIFYSSGCHKDVSSFSRVYWFYGLYKDIAEFVAKCQNCKQIKAEH